MPSIIDSFSSLVSSIFSAFAAFLNSILAIFQSIFTTIFSIFQTILATIGTAISGLAHTFEGLVKFLLSNILVIGGVLAAVFLYGVYQQRNGGQVTTNKQKKVA